MLLEDIRKFVRKVLKENDDVQPQKVENLKVYHGTNEKFRNFSFQKAIQGIVWFTDSIDSIKSGEHGGAGNKYVLTRYITINNPAGWPEYEKYGIGQLKGFGYDGVILPSDDKTDYIVFSPKQIKAFPKYENIKENLIQEEKHLLYHATNSTWTKPEIHGLGFHAGTIKAAQDRLKSFRMNINPHIKTVELDLQNPLYIGRDYRFHDDLSKVSKELYKDKIITKEEANEFARIYDDNATFENLRKLLYKKYGYDGIIYRNNIEDRGSNSYIAFFPEQIKIIDSI